MFKHRLALALGGMTVAELEQRIDSHELTNWLAFYRIDPWGETRADMRNGILASTMVNLKRTRGQKAVTPEDFMPFVERSKKESAKTLKAKLGHLVVKSGTKPERPPNR